MHEEPRASSGLHMDEVVGFIADVYLPPTPPLHSEARGEVKKKAHMIECNK